MQTIPALTLLAQFATPSASAPIYHSESPPAKYDTHNPYSLAAKCEKRRDNLRVAAESGEDHLLTVLPASSIVCFPLPMIPSR